MTPASAGKLFIVGIGPGGSAHMTPAAREAIERSGVVAGYRTYLDLIAPLLAGKEVVCSGMRQEVERCREALALAAAGNTVALVSSGDAGIYGMAGLALEMAEDLQIEIEIVPGISAVQAAAARLGAPLMHDFAVISLSDLLTPWASIRQRLLAAASTDFVVALYNPRSRGRTRQLSEARRILLAHRSARTPVGLVRNAGRADESVLISDLASFPEEQVDMLTTVIIGKQSTFVDAAGRMVTPRGYEKKYSISGIQNSDREPEGDSLRSGPACAARALFIGGTGSDVGKSVISAGLCRLLSRRGFSVAPFKAQNMALNSAVTPEGGEIGRAQALQAAACGIFPHTDMNPILLKPNSETGSQVIVQGRVVGNMSVSEYHAYKASAFSQVSASFARLASRYEIVVMEGAGSIAEINLKAHDITNLRAAAMAKAPVLLVADIDRGGVFAAIVGTLELLDSTERAMIAGVIINRFRGDPSLLAPGIAEIERRCAVPVIGVVPWIDLHLPEEDSVSLMRKKARSGAGNVQVGVVRLPRLSNYTDFDPLENEPDVSLSYVSQPAQLEGLDLVILPGSKNTLADLAFLRASGLAEGIMAHHRRGGRIVGICGGFQMLGCSLADPGGVESNLAAARGLELLEVDTVMAAVKQTHLCAAIPLPGAKQAGLAGSGRISGYEIHMGETCRGSSARPLLRIVQRSSQPVAIDDGAVSADGRVWGSYLHGLFDDPGLRRSFLAPLRAARGLPGLETVENRSLEAELDRLADHLAAHLDLDQLLRLVAPHEREVS